MAKRAVTTAKKTEKKFNEELPELVTCDGCTYFEASYSNKSIAYCHKISMPIASSTQKRCINKILKKL